MNDINFVDITKLNSEMVEKARGWRNKENVTKFMLSRKFIVEEEHKKWVESLKEKRGKKVWIVFMASAPIGVACLTNIDYKSLTSEWGFYIGEDDYRGKGLGKIILYKLLSIFFDDMKFESLFTKVLSKNIIALNLYEKFKFRMITESDLSRQNKISNLVFSKNDWLSNKKSLKNECKFKKV